MKVPHWFRRRPRDLQELCLWKSQEHKIFLLYLSPFCFYFVRRSLSDNYQQLLLLYLCLSTVIYALSAEVVSPGVIPSSKFIMHSFQKYMVKLFGAGVMTGSLHALHHLPAQVRHFGSLSMTSATVFENVNRFLKRSFTGKKNQRKQAAEKFLYMQVNSGVPRQLTGVSIARLESKSVNIEKYADYLPNNINQYVAKIRVNDLVFHSYLYGRNLRCASYYAFVNTDKVFLKIKCIFRANDEVKILCRTYKILQSWSEFVSRS